MADRCRQIESGLRVRTVFYTVPTSRTSAPSLCTRLSCASSVFGNTAGNANAIANNTTNPIIFNVFKFAITCVPSFFAVCVGIKMQHNRRANQYQPSDI